MIVYSNTTPFIALSSIGRIDLLPKLFDVIHVSKSVISECEAGGKIIVTDLSCFDWIKIIDDIKGPMLPVLFELDQGEKQTIALALDSSADLVIIDEKIGRNVAEYLGLKVTGTLGILAKAKQMNEIESFRECCQQMMKQGIRYNTELIEKICKKLGE